MKIKEFLDNMSDWNNYLPLLWLALDGTSEGDVIEMGCGDGSTERMHDYCKYNGRNLYSFETGEKYLQRFIHLKSPSHKFFHVKDWDVAKEECPNPSVILIDHAPGERRIVDVERFKDINGILVLHDTQPKPTAADYGWEKIWGLFKYRVTLDAGKSFDVKHSDNKAWASAVSNSYDMKNWKGISFGPYVLI